VSITVELRPITRAIWRESTRLEVAPDQATFVAANVFSLAQARYEPSWEPHAIYHAGEMVGFVMWGLDTDLPERTDEWWIIRFMIDHRRQRQGLGRAAIRAAIAALSAKPDIKAIMLSLVPANQAAEGLYRSLGFESTGRIEEGEAVYRLPL
jgi:diamine N-acetyltransferase